MLALLSLSKVKMIAAGAGIALAIVTIFGLYGYVQSLKLDLIISMANTVKLKSALRTQAGALRAAQENAGEWRSALGEIQQSMEELSRVQSMAAAETRRLNTIFSRHDLSALALAKPGLVERRIAAGSRDAFRVLHDITAGDLQRTSGAGAAPGAAPAPKP